jgi:predicted AAA+ superfamily ATPase
MKLASQVNEVLGGNVGIQRVRKYLEFLDGSMLVRLVRPLEMRLKKQSGAQKICMADHGIMAAWLDDLVPLDPSALEAAPEVSDMAGRIAESCAGAFLMSLIDQGVHHLPERKDQAEIDFVLSAGDHRVPIEIKYQRRIDPQRDTEALRQFMSKPTNRSPIGVLVTRDDVELKLPAGIVALPLKTLLLME